MARDAPANLLNIILEAAERETPNRWVLESNRIVENSPTMTTSSLSTGRIVYKEPVGIGYYFPLDYEFSDYFNRLSKKFRGNLRRRENQLKKTKNIKAFVKENEAATENDLERFMHLEAKGWKGRAGTAIMCSSELRVFYSTLTKRLSKSGMLRWEYLEVDELTIASNLCIRFGGIVVLWKLGYDEDYSRYSPGGLLFKHMIESAFSDDSIKELYLMTDTKWQTKWNPKQRSFFNLYIYPRRPLPYLLGYAPRRMKDFMGYIKYHLNLLRFIPKWRFKK